MSTPVIYQLPIQVPGMVGVQPNPKFMVSGDSLATVTTAGYLNQVSLESNPVASTDVIQCLYSFNPVTQVGTYGIFSVTVSNGVITLSLEGAAGEVTLPTIANHLMVSTNVSGNLANLTGTAINNGSLQAGLATGTAGTFISYAASSGKGALILAAVANTGNTNTTISNVAMGQASVLSIPDPANAIGRFLVGATATPFVSGNFPQNSGTGGLMVDSGIPVSSLATTSSAVLLTPSADQVITIHNLSLAQGSFAAGSSGHAGTITSFPGTSANGSLILAAVNAGADFATTISNGTTGQAQVISIPDSGASTANFLISKFATTQHITAGALQVDAGFVSSGISTGGTAGGFIAYPATTTNGSLSLTPVGNIGNFAATISNISGLGQASVYTLPDPGAATANFIIDHGTQAMAAGSQLNLAKVSAAESANAVTASGQAGYITTSALTTAGGASYVITWTNTHITATSVVHVTVQGGTNTTQNITFEVVAGSGAATLTIYNNTAATALNGTIIIGYTVF